MTELKKFRGYDTVTEARLALNVLLNQGVQGELRGEHLVAADPLLSNAVGGVQLWIPEADTARASEFLTAFESKRPVMICPGCGSETISFARSVYLFWTIAFALFVMSVFGIGIGPISAVMIGAVSSLLIFAGVWLTILRRVPLGCADCDEVGPRLYFEPKT